MHLFTFYLTGVFVAIISYISVSVITVLLSCLPFFANSRSKREEKNKRVYYIDNALNKSAHSPLFIAPLAILVDLFISWHDDKGLVFSICSVSAIVLISLVQFIINIVRRKHNSKKENTSTCNGGKLATFTAFILVFAVLVALCSSCVAYDISGKDVTAPWELTKDIVGYTSQGTPIVSIDNDIPWEEPHESDCFSEIAYDEENEILYVRFRESDASYRYLNFSDSDWETFVSQDSLGSWYNESIKGQYECQKLEE